MTTTDTVSTKQHKCFSMKSWISNWTNLIFKLIKENSFMIPIYLRGTLTTSSYVTRSNWSNTALCLAKYLSRYCFFFRPKIEQLTAMKHTFGQINCYDRFYFGFLFSPTYTNRKKHKTKTDFLSNFLQTVKRINIESSSKIVKTEAVLPWKFCSIHFCLIQKQTRVHFYENTGGLARIVLEFNFSFEFLKLWKRSFFF